MSLASPLQRCSLPFQSSRAMPKMQRRRPRQPPPHPHRPQACRVLRSHRRPPSRQQFRPPARPPNRTPRALRTSGRGIGATSVVTGTVITAPRIGSRSRSTGRIFTAAESTGTGFPGRSDLTCGRTDPSRYSRSLRSVLRRNVHALTTATQNRRKPATAGKAIKAASA
jgi:hypothetical protein